MRGRSKLMRGNILSFEKIPRVNSFTTHKDKNNIENRRILLMKLQSLNNTSLSYIEAGFIRIMQNIKCIARGSAITILKDYYGCSDGQARYILNQLCAKKYLSLLSHAPAYVLGSGATAYPYDSKAVIGTKIALHYITDNNIDDLYLMNFSSSGEFSFTAQGQFITMVFTNYSNPAALKIKQKEFQEAKAKLYAKFGSDSKKIKEALNNPIYIMLEHGKYDVEARQTIQNYGFEFPHSIIFYQLNSNTLQLDFRS